VSTVRRSRCVYQTIETRLAAVGSGVGAVVFAAIAISGGRGAVVMAIFAAVLALLAGRMSIVGIQVHATGVTVATAFYSRSVAWDEIDHFAVLPVGRFPYVGSVVLRDGRRLSTFGLSTSARKSETNRVRVQQAIDELNHTLGERAQSRPD
jgi:hypothetical protein